MAKNRSKKRSKPRSMFKGPTSQNKPIIHRYEAKARTPMVQWLHERKKLIRIISITTGVILFIALIISGLANIR